MVEVPAADARCRLHGEALGERNAGGLRRAEELEENGLFGVVRAGRIAGCGAYAAVALADQVLLGKVFGPAEAAPFPRALVEQLRQGLRQPVAERLGNDGE